SLHRPQLRGLEATRLRGAGTGAAGRRRNGHRHRYTGLSFGAWKQRACVVQALARLAGGETVTAIALDCGYQSPAAFSTMFRRVLGQPPSAFQAGALRSPGGP
ncbi:helix-turn-helix domain-containing protein, partial [Pseudomonas aeruginosa]